MEALRELTFSDRDMTKRGTMARPVPFFTHWKRFGTIVAIKIKQTKFNRKE
jgi:hypothetical protein